MPICSYSGMEYPNTHFLQEVWVSRTTPEGKKELVVVKNIGRPHLRTIKRLVRAGEWPPQKPSEGPSDRPTERPSDKPSERPFDKPSERPSDKPSKRLSDKPSGSET